MRPRPPKYKSITILKEIVRRGGMRTCEIKKFIFEMNHPTERWKPGSYYNTILYGTDQRQGLLRRFCVKCPGGIWRVVHPIKRPFTPYLATCDGCHDMSVGQYLYPQWSGPLRPHVRGCTRLMPLR